MTDAGKTPGMSGGKTSAQCAAESAAMSLDMNYPGWETKFFEVEEVLYGLPSSPYEVMKDLFLRQAEFRRVVKQTDAATEPGTPAPGTPKSERTLGDDFDEILIKTGDKIAEKFEVGVKKAKKAAFPILRKATIAVLKSLDD